MKATSLLGQLDQIKEVYQSRRAYFSLSYVNGTWLNKVMARDEIHKSSIAEAHIAAFQSDLSLVVCMLWNLLYYWQTPEREEYQRHVNKTLELLVVPLRLENITKNVKPLSTKYFVGDPRAKSAIHNSNFWHYLGVKILRDDFPPFNYSELKQSIEKIRTVDIKNEDAVVEAMRTIGKEHSIDLHRTWNEKYNDDRLN